MGINVARNVGLDTCEHTGSTYCSDDAPATSRSMPSLLPEFSPKSGRITSSEPGRSKTTIYKLHAAHDYAKLKVVGTLCSVAAVLSKHKCTC